MRCTGTGCSGKMRVVRTCAGAGVAAQERVCDQCGRTRTFTVLEFSGKLGARALLRRLETKMGAPQAGPLEERTPGG